MQSYEFGSFRLDTADRMLLREGQYVPLTPKAFETLVVLVRHGGRIVDKEEFLKQVWPDTFVEDVSLAKNVSTLRKILGESEDQRYIETIPKRGYRFVANVRVVEDVPEPVAAPSPVVPPLAPNRRLWLVLPLAALAGVAILIWLTVGRHSRPAPAYLKSVPITSFSGHQSQAAFSPDGRRLAFVWDGQQDRSPHIYVKQVGSETLLQLTRGPATDSKPAWSADGRYLAFLRVSGDHRSWYQVPASGGPERKLADILPFFDLGNGNSPYYAPDGQTLAIVDRDSLAEPSGIFLLPLANLERRRLTSPPPGTTGDYYPSFSPDGKQIAFTRATSFTAADLFVMPLTGRNIRRLTFDGLSIEGIAWTSDGKDIIFSSRRGGGVNSLWRIAVAGGKPERVNVNGDDLISPAVSRAGNRLAYTRQLDDMNIWSVDLDASGHATARSPLIASIFRDSDPDYSPDSQKIAFVSERAGSFGIWVCNRDGSSPRVLFDGGPYVTGSPRWSPDGRSIAFDSRSNDRGTPGHPRICIVNADGGPVRQLTIPPADGVAPSWSHDGRWIYFASSRSGSLEIWKMPVAGGSAARVTRNGGFEAFESANGGWLYYLKGRSLPGIWRVPVDGGDETPLPTHDQAGMWRCWRTAAGGIYYATAAGPPGLRIEFMDLSTGAIREIAQMTKAPDPGIPSLAVAPDGRQLLYAQYDQSGSNIMMVEDLK
jgi:Tol biopolymer transport system component/DNA-binding winged helix-turn-helix (wHTH) protein